MGSVIEAEFPVGDDGQASFNGMPVSEVRWALRGGTKLWTELELPQGKQVSFQGVGRVKGWMYIDGVLTNIIEMVDAEITSVDGKAS